jgi:uncharacterized membrane protein
MERVGIFLLFLMVPPVMALEPPETEMEGNYTITVEENGNALVSLVIHGSGTINLPLPLDVVSPTVEGALYIQAPNGVDISVGSAGRAMVIYHTALLTTKPSETWKLEMELPKFSSALVSISLPRDIEVALTSPKALIAQTSTATNLLWDLRPEENDTIEMQYRFVQYIPPSTPPAPIKVDEAVGPFENTTEDSTRPDIDEESRFFRPEDMFFVLFAVLLFYYMKTRNKGKTISNEGIENVMNTLTDNELTIVNALIQNKGEMKRNKLEKTSGLAKSSLASALYRLEQRNILEVDRSGAIHYIRLTDWFKSL